MEREAEEEEGKDRKTCRSRKRRIRAVGKGRNERIGSLRQGEESMEEMRGGGLVG